MLTKASYALGNLSMATIYLSLCKLSPGTCKASSLLQFMQTPLVPIWMHTRCLLISASDCIDHHVMRTAKKMVLACPGCAIANPTTASSYKPVYHFPMLVLMVDIYKAGTQSSFEVDTNYLIDRGKMTGFCACKPTDEANTKSLQPQS